MRGSRTSLGPRASAADMLRDASVGALLVASAMVFGFVAPVAAQSDDDEATTTEAGDALPTCPAEAAGLELATTLDFADIARPLAPAGASSSPTGSIASYELYCPYGELPPSAASDATPPLELLLRWGVDEEEDGPGCFEGGQEPAEDGSAGVVGDPDRQAQVDWSVADDDLDADTAAQAAEDLLAAAPADTVSCDTADQEAAAAADDGEATTRTPLYVIGAALLVAVLAAVVLLVRRRGHDDAAGEQPQAGTLPLGPAVAATPVAGPLVAGSTAPHRAARSLPPEVLDSMAAAGGDTAERARAVVEAARRAGRPVVGAQAASLGLVAASAGTLADADARRLAELPDEQLAALAAALRTLARSATRAARRAGTAHADASGAELDALVRATTRLVHAHQSLLRDPAAPTETPR